MGRKLDADFSPSEREVGMVAFCLCECSDFIRKRERFGEISELAFLRDFLRIRRELPIGKLFHERFCLLDRERHRAAFARDAFLIG